jgi:hypothetical protein
MDEWYYSIDFWSFKKTILNKRDLGDQFIFLKIIDIVGKPKLLIMLVGRLM